MAYLDDFRGAGEPDSGTAFEVGVAVALNKPAFAYTEVITPLIGWISYRRDSLLGMRTASADIESRISALR